MKKMLLKKWMKITKFDKRYGPTGSKGQNNSKKKNIPMYVRVKLLKISVEKKVLNLCGNPLYIQRKKYIKLSEDCL